MFGRLIGWSVYRLMRKCGVLYVRCSTFTPNKPKQPNTPDRRDRRNRRDRREGRNRRNRREGRDRRDRRDRREGRDQKSRGLNPSSFQEINFLTPEFVLTTWGKVTLLSSFCL